MNTVFIESPKPIELKDLITPLRNQWRVEENESGYVIDFGSSRIYFENGFDAVEKKVYDYHVVLLYSSEELVKEIIKLIADTPHVVVDNDNGVALPGDQFVARLKAEPTWRW